MDEKFREISEKADVCVKCGFCLPACPTYQVTRQESDSPRGRISLVQSVVDAGFSIHDTHIQTHLQSCLTCRACEDMCPAKVEYGEIIDFAKQYSKKSVFRRLLVYVMSRRPMVAVLTRFLFLYQRCGLDFLFKKIGILKVFGLARMAAYLPRISHAKKLQYVYGEKTEGVKGRVGLFLGCVADEFDRKTASDIVKILTKMGYVVVLPKEQGCCGAMHAHGGFVAQADALKTKNHKAFDGLDCVLYSASGCGESLKCSLGDRAQDVNQFIIENSDDLYFSEVKKKVLVHLPCTQRNVMKSPDLTYRLLDLLPGLDAVALPGNEVCCGAAGINMFEHPAMADRLRDDKLAGIGQVPFDVLVTTNIGCSLHLAAGLRKQGMGHRVLHPVSLVLESMV